MALKIIKSTEIIPVETLIMLIYGQPGIGKTSFGYTASKPLNLDFDKGVHRTKNRVGDTLLIESWATIQELIKEPELLQEYDTIILDTVGRCLDMLSDYIISGNAKLGTKNGSLTMQGWGELKSLFTTWMKHLRKLGKDIIMIAHEKEEKEGDNTRKRPEMQGGSYSEVIKVSDLIGYMCMENNVPVLSFTPCDAFYAKNGANIKIQQIPDYSQKPDFAKQLISHAKIAMTNMSEDSRKVAESLLVWTDTINSVTRIEEFNTIYQEIKNLEPALRAQVKIVLIERSKQLGFVYAKALDEWVNEPVNNQPPPTPPALPATEGTKNGKAAKEVPKNGKTIHNETAPLKQEIPMEQEFPF